MLCKTRHAAVLHGFQMKELRVKPQNSSQELPLLIGWKCIVAFP